MTKSTMPMLLGLLVAGSLFTTTPSASAESYQRGTAAASLDEPSSCGSRLLWGLCGQEKSRSVRASTVSRQPSAKASQHRYNAIQRIAAMFIDDVEAAHVGNMKIKFRIILE